MLRFWVPVLGSAVLVLCSTVAGVAGQSQRSARVLSCDGPFAPTMTAESLAAVFGQANVTTEDVHVGEGFFEKGTVLFSKSPEDRLEIHWRDEQVPNTPSFLKVRAERTRWRTAGGLTIGLHLRAVERLNRRPFRLSGFGWDYGGGVQNWSGGMLERVAGEGCQVSARLTPAQNAAGEYALGAEKFLDQVGGERHYSSGHPAMQVVNPIVRELFLLYRSQKR